MNNNYKSKICPNFKWGWSFYLEISKMWCMRKMEYISWIYLVKKEEILIKVQEERNILHTIKRRTVKWTCQMLRRNCLLKRVIEGKTEGRIEVTERRGRRCLQLLGSLNEKTRYGQLK
jgi:hypothetical protein